MLRHVTCQICSIPLKKSFSISRGTKTTADVIRLEIKQGENLGRALPKFSPCFISSLITSAVVFVPLEIENDFFNGIEQI